MAKPSLAQDIEDSIRAGRLTEARALLAGIENSKIPRAEVAKYSNLARRAGLLTRALRIAAPVVRPHNSLQKPATVEERTEYAAALIRIGAVGEGRDILEEIKSSARSPTSELYLALANFAEWDYDRSIVSLEAALSGPRTLDPYLKLLLTTNLISALIFSEDWTRADYLLKECLQEAKEHGFRVLEGNLLELSTQSAVSQKNYTGARGFILTAERLLEDASEVSQLFVKKWASLCDLYECKGSPETVRGVREVQVLANRLRHWETVRDCDYHLANATRSVELYHYLYFGTPYLGYRARLTKTFADLRRPSAPFWRTLGGALAISGNHSSHEPLSWMDPFTGEGSKIFAGLDSGGLAHRTLQVLASDSYRPSRLGQLFGQIFLGEYFSPFGSANRVHQAVRKLREVVRKNRIPISIDFEHGAYHLRAVRPFTFRISAISTDRGIGHDRVTLLLRKIQMVFPEQSFTSQGVSKKLAISVRTANRIISAGIELGVFIQTGRGPRAQYRAQKP